MFFHPIARDEMIRVVGVVQRSVCSYGGASRCDCKFGVGERLTMGEVGCGCPEMRTLQVVLLGLSKREYDAAYKRGHRRMRTKRFVALLDPPRGGGQ
jgi:hypothetical protein